ncbi:MAG: ATP-binding protein [bacterium]
MSHDANALTTSATDAHQINFAWLLRLRWGAIAGQTLTVVLVERLLHFELPLGPIFAIIGLELATNIGCTAWADGRAITRERPLVLLLAFDIVALTALLYFSGGPMNPFNFLYLVHLALAAVVVSPFWTWGLAALSLSSFGALFIAHRELRVAGVPHAIGAHDMSLHVQGMWVAFAVAAVFIVYFVSRVSRGLAEREAELARTRSLAERSEKLASLATLAAGAAHELATPLSTIAVVAKELERELERRGAAGGGAFAGDGVVQDARLIRTEVERCHKILEHMAVEAGESPGEGILSISVAELIDAALEAAPDRARVRTRFDGDVAARELRLPPRAVAEALRAVIKNAAEASPDGARIFVDAAVDGDVLRIAVRDDGGGMPPAVLARAGEPFFTTKGPGRGMGLGLFLTRAVIERLGGTLGLDSAPARGTTVTLSLPLVAPATRGHMAESGAP